MGFINLSPHVFAILHRHVQQGSSRIFAMCRNIPDAPDEPCHYVRPFFTGADLLAAVAPLHPVLGNTGPSHTYGPIDVSRAVSPLQRLSYSLRTMCPQVEDGRNSSMAGKSTPFRIHNYKTHRHITTDPRTSMVTVLIVSLTRKIPGI